MGLFRSRRIRRDTKRVFLKKGTCSRTFFFLLNRKFGHSMEKEEQAADPLAGGILQQGYQCGMLWGAGLAVSAEAFRRTGGLDAAIRLAVPAVRHVRESFLSRTGTPDCEEITRTDWKRKWSILSYMLRGKMFTCFRLADRWAPEAFAAAEEGLNLPPEELPEKPRSCAAEVVGRMGGSEAEKATVSGLAGGIGLSGDGCSALGAAIWKHTLERARRGNYKYSLSDTGLEHILTAFYTETRGAMECRRICGREFADLADHSDYIRKGGCGSLLQVLADAAGE